MNFNENLRKIRINKGFTQSDMAEKLHYTLNGYQKWEQGEREPKIFHIKKIKEILNCSYDELLD